MKLPEFFRLFQVNYGYHFIQVSARVEYFFKVLAQQQHLYAPLPAANQKESGKFSHKQYTDLLITRDL